jgi:hypothetical protein
MRALARFISTLLLTTFAAAAARAEGVTLTEERQAYLEGVWMGVSADVSADKLCSLTNPPAGATTLSIEFMRSGGMGFADNGTESAARGVITEASEADGVVTLTFGNEVWRLRPDSDKVMSRVRSSASIGGDVDSMVFKRCQKAADRSAIALDRDALTFLAADLPGDEAFFMDERLAAKTGKRCAVEDTQYLFFVLLGPAEFRVSRWNSFSLADKLASNQTVKLPPLDPVMNWKIESARVEGAKYVVHMKDYDDAKAAPETIHIEVKPNGSITIPEWHRTFVRCKGFQSRS